mgnify:CR=1 FL=1
MAFYDAANALRAALPGLVLQPAGQWPGLEGMRRERAEDLADSEIHGQSHGFPGGQTLQSRLPPSDEALERGAGACQPRARARLQYIQWEVFGKRARAQSDRREANREEPNVSEARSGQTGVLPQGNNRSRPPAFVVCSDQASFLYRNRSTD